MTLGQEMNGPIEATKDSEFHCEECGARITETKSIGEAGHRRGCQRRAEKYKGLAGKREFRSGRMNTEGSA